jgi:hypothetical protein
MLEPHAALVGILDDRAAPGDSLGNLQITPTARWRDLAPTVIIASSDTYETAMAERLRSAVSQQAQVWTVYT